MKGRAIWDAYADCDMSKPCPECKAAPNTWCTNPITGRVRRVPCVHRPTAAVAPVIPLRTDCPDPVDFAEPRRHTEDEPW